MSIKGVNILVFFSPDTFSYSAHSFTFSNAKRTPLPTNVNLSAAKIEMPVHARFQLDNPTLK